MERIHIDTRRANEEPTDQATLIGRTQVFLLSLELKYRAPEYKPSNERLPQLLIDKQLPIHKRMSERVLKTTSLGLRARKTGVV